MNNRQVTCPTIKLYAIRHLVNDVACMSNIAATSWEDAATIALILGGAVDGEISFQACAKCGAKDQQPAEYWADTIEV